MTIAAVSAIEPRIGCCGLPCGVHALEDIPPPRRRVDKWLIIERVNAVDALAGPADEALVIEHHATEIPITRA